MQPITCPKCESVNDFYTELKGNNNVARCNKCNAFIKNIPYEQPKFFIGKYKDKLISEIDDISYLKWAYQNMDRLSKSTREHIQQRIDHLEFIAK